MSNLEKQDLQKALDKSLELVRDTISWVEARGWTNEQSFLDWEDKLNALSVKDHKINFFNYKYMD